MANGAWSNEVSFDGGKFKARVVYKYSAGSFSWQYEIKVTQKFKSKHYYVPKWLDANGVWQQGKTDSTHNGDYTTPVVRNLARSDLRVKVQVGLDSKDHKTVTLETITKDYTASPPSQVDVSKVNDARYQLSIRGTGYAGSPITKLTIERMTDSESSWSSIGEISLNASGSYSESFTDDTTEAGHKYRWRVKATNRSGDSGYTMTDSEYTSPETSVDLDVQEGSGYNTIVWSVDSVADIDRGIIEGWYVTRSTNGGAYETIGTVRANPSQYNYEYIDSDISSGNTYKYALQSFGQGGSSHQSEEGGSEISTPPSRPISVNAWRNEDDYIVVEIVDAQNTADSVLIERSIDGHDFTQIAEQDFPCDRYLDTTAVGSDTIKYRVRNKNSKGYSDYTESNSVLLKSPPNPPSLLSPYNNAVMSIDDQPIRFVWQHNATDGSPQTKAEIIVKVNGIERTYTVDSESYIEIAGFDVNDTIEWRARTKGSHFNYSNYSEPYTFKVLKKPEISIISPLNSETITTLPIVLKWLYDDLSGKLKELKITLIKNNKTEATYNVNVGEGESGEYEYSLAGFLFENDTVYGIRLDALSSSGLRASQLISVVIEYEPVSLDGGLLPTIVTDEETGFAYITIQRDITDDEGTVPDPIPIREAYLYRLHDKQRTLLGSVSEGSQIIDKYAPLNVDFNYELLQLTEDGRISLVSTVVNLPSVLSFIYFGNGDMFKGKWNPKIGSSYERPEMVEKRYSGREYPIIYDSPAKAEKNSYSCVLVDRADLVQLKDLMRAGHGRGIWKSVDGDSFDAVFKLSVDTDKFYKNQYWTVSLDITRIEKDG